MTKEFGTCRHLWILLPPDGPESEGTCTECGAKRMFNNSDDPQWKKQGTPWRDHSNLFANRKKPPT